jgi:hypothetical protein
MNLELLDVLSAQQLGNVANLLDVHSPGQCTMYEGGSITLYHHLVIFCNVEALAHLVQGLRHKQIWLLKMESWDQPSITWHFPGEAPTVEPYVGACGGVANYADPRRVPPPIPDWLKGWMLRSLPNHLPDVAGPLPAGEDALAREAFLAGMLHACKMQTG